MIEVSFDQRLLTVARQVLSDRRFRVQENSFADLEHCRWLLAESEDFLLAVTTGESLDDLMVLEGYLTVEMDKIFDSAPLGPKRWDSYAVLLTGADDSTRGTPGVLRMQYNTRSLRRIVSTAVYPDEDSISRALATFFPLPQGSTGGLASPYEELIEELVLNGVDAGIAKSEVVSYRLGLEMATDD